MAIEDAFSLVPYPESCDFNQAIADYDYMEDRSEKKKFWFEVSENDLKRYGEIIHFFDEAGALYYLPAYMVNLIFHEALWDLVCFDSLVSFLKEVDLELFTDKQKHVVSQFLSYSSSFIDDDIDIKELKALMERFLV